MKLLIINGPNLNRLGVREPEVYGTLTYADLKTQLTEFGNHLGVTLLMRQTNHEGVIIDWLHDAEASCDGILLNAGALTHYSYAIYDAIKSISTPVVEVHLTDLTSRIEVFRHTSVIASACIQTFSGLGFDSYKAGIEFLIKDVK